MWSAAIGIFSQHHETPQRTRRNLLEVPNPAAEPEEPRSITDDERSQLFVHNTSRVIVRIVDENPRVHDDDDDDGDDDDDDDTCTDETRSESRESESERGETYDLFEDETSRRLLDEERSLTLPLPVDEPQRLDHDETKSDDNADTDISAAQTVFLLPKTQSAAAKDDNDDDDPALVIRNTDSFADAGKLDGIVAEPSPFAQEALDAYTRRVQSDADTQCTGCTSFVCVKKINIFDVLSWSNDGLQLFLKNHNCIFRRHPCEHPTATGETIVLLHTPDAARKHACPYPRCEKASSPSAPLIVGNYNRGGRSDVSERVYYAMLWSIGLTHTVMRNTMGVKASKNTLTEWRGAFEELLTAAHAIDTVRAKGTVRYAQFDEFCMGTRKYGRGAAVSANDQMWFQSAVVTDGPQIKGEKQRVIAFYVRYVPNRTRDVLIPWMVGLLDNNAEIVTDSWKSYDLIKEAAKKEGKTIKAGRVNHSKMYCDFKGRNTNSVEGMHMHLKQFLRKFVRIGSEKIDRINRVAAAALMSNPAGYHDAPPFLKVFRALKTVSECGVPASTVAADYLVKPFVGPYTIAGEYEGKLKDVVTGTDITFGSPKRGREEFDKYLADAEALRVKDKAERSEKAKRKRSAKVDKKIKKLEAEMDKCLQKKDDMEAVIAHNEKTIERELENLQRLRAEEDGVEENSAANASPRRRRTTQ